MCLICKNENLEGLKELYCGNCPQLNFIPLIKGLKELTCWGCPLITFIPIIKGLKKLTCYNCPQLISIPNIEELTKLNCYNCPLLTFIPNISKLKNIYCINCPNLMYHPISIITTNLTLPFKTCKYKTSIKMNKLYNNIYKLWKNYKLKKYIFYLIKEYYANPKYPYILYYIENMDLVKNKENKIGFINSKNKLIWYKF